MDDGDEIIVLRVSTIDLSGKKKKKICRLVCFTQQNTENRFYLQQNARANQSRAKGQITTKMRQRFYTLSHFLLLKIICLFSHFQGEM